MVLISQNTHIDVDSAEPYGRLTVIRAVTLQPATRTVAGIFATGKMHPGKLCVCVPDIAVTGCCCRAAALIFTVWRIYWDFWVMARYQHGQKNRRGRNQSGVWEQVGNLFLGDVR